MLNQQRNPKEPPFLSWAITIGLFLVGAWPIALFTLFRILSVGSITSPPKQQKRSLNAPSEPIDLEPVEVKPAKKSKASKPVRRNGVVPIPKKWGKRMSFWGLIATVVTGLMLGDTLLSTLSFLPYGLTAYDIRELLQITGFFAGSLVVLLCGLSRKGKANRYRRYLQLIGQRETISVETLAQALPVSYRHACNDLQDMLERGFLPAGYIDRTSKRLILSENGLREEAPKAQEPVPEQPAVPEDDVLQQIRQLRDNIEDLTMRQKVDRIGEITARILDYQKAHPDCAEELRSFLDYYLPTTLKILRSYEQMEEQRITGENIRTTKAKVEGMMDQVVEGFETRLDKLFHAEAVDITSDVQVLEQMLRQDGLTGEELKFPHP